MRPTRFAALIGAACVLAGGDATAQTFAQMVPGTEAAPAPLPAPPRPPRVTPESKSAPTRTRAPNAGTAANAPASPPIPLPNRALLLPAPTFDCAFKTPDTAPQLASADAAQTMKLDYERQCHRQTAMIVRDRLRALQAAVGPTIKAAGRAQPALPLPGRDLLAPVADFGCEFTAAGSDEAALRTKLDYERQCYQHSAMITRDRLRRLQAAVGATIGAAGRQGRRQPL